MAWYPFDTQRCRMILTLASSADLMMELQPGELNYFGSQDLTMYFIKGSKIETGMMGSKPMVYVECGGDAG